MNINKLEIENFKCFGEKTVIPFKPITLIYGENGAGKSAILQAIRLLQSGLNHYLKKTPISHRSETNDVEFKTVSHNSITEHTISISARFQSAMEGLSYFSCDFVKHEKSELVRPMLPKMNSEYLAEWKSELLHQLYPIMLERRSAIVRNYTRYIELLLMQEHYLSEKSIRKEILESLSKGVEDVETEGGFLYSRLNLNLLPDCNVAGLENWIDFAPPEWLSYREQETYKARRSRLLEEHAQDIYFFQEHFEFDEFEKRYEKNIDLLFPVIFQTDDYKSCYELCCDTSQLLIRDILLCGKPTISIDENEDKLRFEGELWLKKKGFYLYSPTDPETDVLIQFPMAVESELVRVSPRSLIQKWYAFVSDYNNRIMSSLAILPPLREAPQDYYHDDSILGAVSKSPVMRRHLNLWLNKLGTGYEVEFVFDQEKGVSLLLFDTCRNMIPVKISETGFGFSQILPIVLECVDNAPKCIMIEEPELHIHPRLQAELGSLFVDAYKENDHQIVAETHSEHLMLRIQRLIRTSKLNPEDVCVLYVSRHETGSSVQQLRLDEDGEFLDLWPSGFFPEREKEVFGGEV